METGSLVALTPQHPISRRLTPGAKVSVAAGTVWLTQEGMHDDIVLTPGREFVVPVKGMQVISAVDAPALVRIADIHQQARALRRSELRRLFWRVRSFFANAFSYRGITRRARYKSNSSRNMACVSQTS